MKSRVLLIVALLGVAGVGAAQSTETVIEPLSNTPFPVALVPPGGATEQRLTGTGLRERFVLFIGVHVYAFGLYVDADGARASLSGFAGRSATELAGDQRFYTRLLDLEFAMTLRLVMVRTVAGGDVANAFDDALRPRMAAAGAGEPGDSIRRWNGFAATSTRRRSRPAPRSCSPARRRGG